MTLHLWHTRSTFDLVCHMRNKEFIDQLLPLPLPVFHLLLALLEGERHGYALKREILQRTDGKINLGSGALYGSINKMLEQELIEESDERPDAHLDDERRRYYRITGLGRKVVQAEALRLRELVRLAEGRLKLPEPA
jgi:DNA-binding PadR family transcriptional regulator